MPGISNHPYLGNCGATTVAGVSWNQNAQGAENFVKQMMGSKEKWAFYVMADAQMKDPKNTLCQGMQKYVEKHNLGSVIETGWYYNEAHGPRYINIYVFTPDWEGEDTKKWLDEFKPKPDKGNMYDY